MHNFNFKDCFPMIKLLFGLFLGSIFFSGPKYWLRPSQIDCVSVQSVRRNIGTINRIAAMDVIHISDAVVYLDWV